jgi:3-hydroxyacyl-[acyl-carrier-protein] dehydratase
MPPELHYDLTQVDFTKVIGDKEAIRKVNPQRYEMEQLDAIIHLDAEKGVIVGYKEVRHDEFWVRGHMPGYPLMPGVLMCEASAQLCSYYVMTQRTIEDGFLGFGGLENVRFRSPVKPGDRLVLVAKEIRYNRRQMVFNVQAFVRDTMVFHGDIIGVPLKNPEG